MRMSHLRHTPTLRARLAGDGGFSLFIVLMVLFVSGMFVAAGYAAANGDLPLSGHSRDRKTTFAAAEAGVNFYQFHLNQDNDYWLKCTAVNAPNTSELSPVSQEWTGNAADPRNWRSIPSSTSQYTIELLPAPGKSACVPGDGKSMLDPVSNVFRIRVTGRPDATSNLRRSIIATFRRTGFLDFLYFTNYETLDPTAYATTSEVANANRYCANRPRAQRKTSGWGCTEIQFADQDAVNGPMHTNDTILMCGTPTFGRDAKDRVTVFGPSPGWEAACNPTTPNFKSPLRLVTKSVDMPPSNDELKKIVLPAYHYFGKTTIHFDTANPTKMWVTNTKLNGATAKLVDVPSNGVVYVDGDVNASGVPLACTTKPPTATDYTDSNACGNLYVDGTYSSSMTLAAANDIIVKPYTVAASGYSTGDLVKANEDVVMGLIANNFVRVYHPCSSSNGNLAGSMNDVKIDAAILTLQHSFIVDNFRCGNPLNVLKVTGAIAQKYRGPVGMGSPSARAHGYVKDYWYDDRLKYRAPPFFLQPTSSSWNVVRFNEQLRPR
jgi:hypothetical protein